MDIKALHCAFPIFDYDCDDVDDKNDDDQCDDDSENDNNDNERKEQVCTDLDPS